MLSGKSCHCLFGPAFNPVQAWFSTQDSSNPCLHGPRKAASIQGLMRLSKVMDTAQRCQR